MRQVKQKPTITIAKSAEPLMTEEMLEVKDIVARSASDVAQKFGIQVDQIFVREEFEPYEDDPDTHGIIFHIRVFCNDDATGHAYWEAVVDAAKVSLGKPPEEAWPTLDDPVCISVGW